MGSSVWILFIYRKWEETKYDHYKHEDLLEYNTKYFILNNREFGDKYQVIKKTDEENNRINSDEAENVKENSSEKEEENDRKSTNSFNEDDIWKINKI